MSRILDSSFLLDLDFLSLSLHPLEVWVFIPYLNTLFQFPPYLNTLFQFVK